MQIEFQTNSSRIWTLITNSISYDNNCYIIRLLCHVVLYNEKAMVIASTFLNLGLQRFYWIMGVIDITLEC